MPIDSHGDGGCSINHTPCLILTPVPSLSLSHNQTLLLTFFLFIKSSTASISFVIKQTDSSSSLNYMANLSSLSAISSSFESLSSSLPSFSYSNNYFCNTGKIITRKPSLGSMQAASSISVVFCDSDSDDENKPCYFLDACFLCRTPLHVGDDIYMYRGDTPFCSQECRQEQIEIDEAQENKDMKKTAKKNMNYSKISRGGNPSKSNNLQQRAAQTVVAG